MKRRLSLFFTISLLAVTSWAQAAEKRVIIGFRTSLSLSESAKHEKVFQRGGRVERSHKFVSAISAQLPEEEIARLKSDSDVAYVEADSVVTAVEPVMAAAAPLQEYLDSWGVLRIGAEAAAAAGIRGAGVKVAILDTGIDYSHPDLMDNYKGGYNFVYDNNDPFDDSFNSHGTHLAGIIGAKDNGTGVAGVAPDVSLYAVKVLNGGMAGSLSDIIAGIEWAITNKMNVINMSLGGTDFSQAFQDACDKAYKAGIVLVSSAGNFNSPVVNYPAAFDSVIAVSATGLDDSHAPFSNYGPKIELAAPGVGIKSTIKGGGYGSLFGTSQATAHVSGAVALLLSTNIQDVNGDGSVADEVRQRLAETARDLGDPGRDSYFGYGLVNVAKAVNATPKLNSAPVITSVAPTTASEGAAYSYAVAATDADGDPLSYSLIVAPAGMTVDASTGNIRWTPGYDQAGIHTVTVHVSDGIDAVTQTYSVTVANTNRPPVITSSAPVTASEGKPYSYTVTATDADGDVLAYSLVTAPEGMTINSSTGVIAWTPTYRQAGSYNITVQVSDGASFAVQTYSLTVADVKKRSKDRRRGTFEKCFSQSPAFIRETLDDILDTRQAHSRGLRQ